MDSDLTLEGKEYKDKLICVSTVHVPIWLRFKNLFCPYLEFKLEIYTEEIMPRYQVVRYIRSISYCTKLKTLYRVYRAKGKGFEKIHDELK